MPSSCDAGFFGHTACKSYGIIVAFIEISKSLEEGGACTQAVMETPGCIYSNYRRKLQTNVQEKCHEGRNDKVTGQGSQVIGIHLKTLHTPF